MKTIGKAVLAIVIVLYMIIAILLTLCLFNLNNRGLAAFDLTTVIPLEDNYSSEYKEGDLVLVSKQSRSKSDVEIGDGIFYYSSLDSNFTIEYGIVNNIIAESSNNDTYVVGKDYNVYYNNFIGNRITHLGHVGGLYKILMSQFGYLALVILPTLVMVVVEIYAIIMEIITIKSEMSRPNENTQQA